MASPLISILLPNLNNVQYLTERLETIYSQSVEDWELIVVDNYSDDGAWELFQEHTLQEPRMRLSSAPREGMYANWNNCLRQAQGQFIYIATSDDTMQPTCLEELKAALDNHPTASLAQCGLEIIGPDGSPVPETESWENYTLGQYERDFVTRPNLRLAPHDGLLHTALFTVCTSITQLLIKRSVFTEIGLFESRWGSLGDFEWQMRAALVFNCVFIPAKLASWRIHPDQATGKLSRLEICRRHLEMAESAFSKTDRMFPGKFDTSQIRDFMRFLELDLLEYESRERPNWWTLLLMLSAQASSRPAAALDWLMLKARRRPWALWGCPERTKRLNAALSKWKIPSPLFLDAASC